MTLQRKQARAIRSSAAIFLQERRQTVSISLCLSFLCNSKGLGNKLDSVRPIYICLNFQYRS